MLAGVGDNAVLDGIRASGTDLAHWRVWSRHRRLDLAQFGLAKHLRVKTCQNNTAIFSTQSCHATENAEVRRSVEKNIRVTLTETGLVDELFTWTVGTRRKRADLASSTSKSTESGY